MATQKKIATVALLSDKISRAHAMVFVDYRGLTHKQIEQLRKLLKKVEAELTVAKNRLMNRALQKRLNLEKQGLTLKDTTATLFAYGDEVPPIKELLKYFKTAGVGKPKSGFLGDTMLSEADVTKLASLPTREVLLGRLVGRLNAPIQGLHYAVSWNIRKLLYALSAVKAR